MTFVCLVACSYLDQGAVDNDTSEVQDVCSVTLNNRSCGVSRASFDSFTFLSIINQVFFLMFGKFGSSESVFVCSQVTDAVANVAKVLHCAAGSQLTLSEQTVMSLMEELTERLNLLIQELLASVGGETCI